MADDEFMFRRVGAAQFPPDLTTSPKTLADVFDPSQALILSFFQTALNAELDKAWRMFRGGTSFEARRPVETVIPAVPTKGQLRAQAIAMPALFLARTQAEAGEYAMGTVQIETSWSLDYMIGPVSAAEHRRFGGLLYAVHGVLAVLVRDRFHASFNGGALVFDPSTDGGRFRAWKLGAAEMGPAEFGEQGEGLEFLALHATLMTLETDEPIPGTESTFDGGTLRLDDVVGEEVRRSALVANLP